MKSKSNSCFGCLILVILAIVGIGFLAAPRQPQPTPAASAANEPSPFTFVRSKTETNGWHNVMDLYALKSEFDLDAFRRLCLQKKASTTAKAFTYVVLFDNAASAAFPTTPFTAGFGLEDDKMKHIIAIYECNKVNGFSELTVYNPNMLEGRPQTEKL